MGKPRDTKIAILPSTTRKGTTLSTSAALDSPSVIDKLVSPPHASRAGTSAESENSHNIDNVSAVLDDSGSLGSFLDATIAKSRQIENTETPNATTPVNSPKSVEYSSDDLDEDYVELDNDFIEKCKATTDARKIKKLLAEHAVRYKPSPDPKFATSPINIRDKDYDFSLDLSHIAIVEKTPFCGTEKESAVEHLTELSTLSGVFSDDVKMRTYFVAKIFPFSLKDDAKTWYNNLPPGSIKSPTDLRDVFFRNFPASAQHAALQRIYNFDQEDGEKLPEAWARFCSLIRAQPDHDLEKHDLLDIFYSGLTIESRAYLDSCAGCVFRKRTPEDAEELLAKIGRNHDDWSTPEPTPTPIVKKRGMIKLNDEDMREAKKSLKEKGIKPEDVKNLPPIEDICETIPPSSMIEYMKDIVTNKRKVPNEEISTMLANYSFNGKIPKKLGDPAIGVPQWGSCEKIRGTPRELSDLYTRICNGRSLSNDGDCKKEKILTKFAGESYEFNFSKFAKTPYKADLPNDDFRVEQCASIALAPSNPLQQHLENSESEVFREERDELDEIFLRQPILKHDLPVEDLGVTPPPKEDPVFDLKPLPDNLKYAYIDEKKTYPVIISAKLSDIEEERLLEILKKHRAIGYTLDDLKGISPAICQHAINIEDGAKPVVEHQRRLIPKMNEVLKLLEAGIIYPIADSRWVSPVHCVPKKGGITVVPNDNDELIPQRVVVGSRATMSSSEPPKDNFFENVVNPYISELKMHPKELLLVDGELQIEDVRGLKGEGSLEDRMEKLEQEVFTYKKMAEREVDIFHRIVSELIGEHEKETAKLWSDILSLHNTTNKLQAQLYDAWNQNCDYENRRRREPKGGAERGHHGPPIGRRGPWPRAALWGGAHSPLAASPSRTSSPENLRPEELRRIDRAASAGRKNTRQRALRGQESAGNSLRRGNDAIAIVIELDIISIVITIISIIYTAISTAASRHRCNDLGWILIV
ncbi:hypothetical protein QYE76_000475 [Lolium multiflorum]|uniref:Retrotransposon gag domain-containing protein n=1 Tax=Lolium multiflorum TaxID=4521 RepID=A0AAD8VVZ0_LOLMU|nr:hypothetical protein QYE76_000475 [Lolium multiflorum]